MSQLMCIYLHLLNLFFSCVVSCYRLVQYCAYDFLITFIDILHLEQQLSEYFGYSLPRVWTISCAVKAKS